MEAPSHGWRRSRTEHFRILVDARRLPGVPDRAGLQERLYVHGLNTRDHWVLVICSELGPCAAVEIATRVPIDPASISRTVHSLVQSNLLARRRSKVDRRQVMLRVTPDGQEQLRQLSQSAERLRTRVDPGNLGKRSQTPDRLHSQPVAVDGRGLGAPSKKPLYLPTQEDRSSWQPTHWIRGDPGSETIGRKANCAKTAVVELVQTRNSRPRPVAADQRQAESEPPCHDLSKEEAGKGTRIVPPHIQIL